MTPSITYANYGREYLNFLFLLATTGDVLRSVGTGQVSDLHLFSFFFFTGETDAGGEGVAIDVYLLICGTRGPTLSDARTTPTLGAPIDGPGALLSSSVDSSFFSSFSAKASSSLMI